MKKISLMKSKKFVTYAKQILVLMRKMMMMTIKSIKVRDHCHYTKQFRAAAYNICNLRYKIPKKIPVIIYNGSTYDYHFIINQLAKKVKGKLECLGENTEKYITLSAPFNKKRDNGKTITYKLKLLIALDLCRPHYQNLLNIYHKNLIVMSAETVNLNLTICQSKEVIN